MNITALDCFAIYLSVGICVSELANFTDVIMDVLKSAQRKGAAAVEAVIEFGATVFYLAFVRDLDFR